MRGTTSFWSVVLKAQPASGGCRSNEFKNDPRGLSVTRNTKIFIICLGILNSIVILQLLAIYLLNNHSFVYPVDDTYIHLAISKNIVDYGIWGISKYHFAPASSSLLYTVLLSLARASISQTELTCLFINLFSGILICYIIYKFILRYNLHEPASITIYLATIFLTPLPSLIISGMEHTLQVAIDLLYMLYGYYLLSDDRKLRTGELIWLSILSALVTAIRYEGLFLLGLMSACFILRRKFSAAFLGFCMGLLPVCIFGIYSISQGSYFLPNSVLIKGHTPGNSLYGFILFIELWITQLCDAPHLPAAMLGLTFCLILRRRHFPITDAGNLLLILVISLILMHTMFAKVGWFFRYDAYLIALSIVATAIALKDIHFKFARPLPIILCIIILAPLCARSASSLINTAKASNNIYEQQIQMAHFIKKYYNQDTIAINDIGSISYFTQANVIDLAGLATKDTMDLIISKNYNRKTVSKVVRSYNGRIAIIYDEWLGEKPPAGWIKTWEWTLRDNVTCGSETVSFYAFNEADAKDLIDHLRDFSSVLPATVIQHDCSLQ